MTRDPIWSSATQPTPVFIACSVWSFGPLTSSPRVASLVVPISLRGSRIFLASPGGLEAERTVCRATIAEFNSTIGLEAAVSFLPTGWEDVPGGVGRPQGQINEELHKADYLLVLLWDRWGSAASVSGGFSSGTEEEFFTGLADLAEAQAPMRDVLVLFKAVEPRQLSDPGEQLAQVLAFRQRLEASKEILFHTFDTEADLVLRLEQNLRKWSGHTGPKEPRHVGLGPVQVEQAVATAADLGQLGSEEILARAEDLETRGLATQAEVAFSLAISSHVPTALLKAARFMRRSGRLDRAVQLNDEFLGLEEVAISTDPVVVAQRSEALANIGVVLRKQGALRESRARLEEAVATARGTGSAGESALLYALDNLGITLQRLGALDLAAAAFHESLSIRRADDDNAGEAQSLLNLARIAKLIGDLATAIEYTKRSMDLLAGEDTPALANALCSHGEMLVADSRLADARPLLEGALAMNRRLANSDGLSIASAQLSRLWLGLGDDAKAQVCADEARMESARSSNREGSTVALQLFGRIARFRGEFPTAVGLFEEAVIGARAAGDPLREAGYRLDLAVTLETAGMDGADVELAEARRLVAHVSPTPVILAEIDEVEARLP